MGKIFDIINVPFGMLLKGLYYFTSNYAITLLIFALIVKLAMFPLGIKQQKSQIKMKKIQPKEQAIRKKYAGRNDTATQQKMQMELQDLYKKENYSPFAGCLPMLIQLPIIYALYSIIRNPLTYISGLAADTLTNLKTFVFENFGDRFADLLKGITETNIANIDQIKLVRMMNESDVLSSVQQNVAGMADFNNIDFTAFGSMNLTDLPSSHGFLSLFILIPVLNLIFGFLQTRLNKTLNPAPGASDPNNPQNNMSMKIFEYTMPLLYFYMAYTWYAALGLYWIYQSVFSIIQMIILAKMMPMPVISPEEFKAAEAEYGAKKKKKKKVESGDGDSQVLPEGESIALLEESDETDEKYVSENFKGGISAGIKKNYQKTGKKYSVKRKK